MGEAERRHIARGTGVAAGGRIVSRAMGEAERRHIARGTGVAAGGGA